LRNDEESRKHGYFFFEKFLKLRCLRACV
jgi:hypothetical protein